MSQTQTSRACPSMSDGLSAHERLQAMALAARLRAVEYQYEKDECEFLAKEIDRSLEDIAGPDGRLHFGWAIKNGLRQMGWLGRQGYQ